jgi:hypothetical protein
LYRHRGSVQAVWPMGRVGLALPFHDHGTRRGWRVSVKLRPLFTPGKDPVPILQEAEWAPGPVWTVAENLAHTGIRSPDRPDRSYSLYRLSYPAHSDDVAAANFREFIVNPLRVIKIPDRPELCNATYLSPYSLKYLLYISARTVYSESTKMVTSPILIWEYSNRQALKTVYQLHLLQKMP